MHIATRTGMMFAALIMAATAQAGLLVNSIRMDVGGSAFSVGPGTTFLDASIEFGTAMLANPVCTLELETLDNVGGKQLCGGPVRNTVTAFEISGYNSGSTELQFGLDWGRGGFSVLVFEGELPVIGRYTNDIWWGYSWGNSDVLSLNLDTTGAFNLLMLGFEGCCNGANSARWRSAGGDWQAFSVVPLPSVLSLFALGLVGLGFYRARRDEGDSMRLVGQPLSR